MNPADRAIDWRLPWLAPYRRQGETVQAALVKGKSVAAALNAHDERPVAFVPADARSPDRPYEQFIRATGGVPTRDNWHDLFNGLAWLVFPLAKQRLNELHAEAMASSAGRTPAARGPLRDAITVFDENGALLQADERIVQALAARNWQRVFVELRPLWSHTRLVLFGHALLEKLMHPRKAICAHVLPLPLPLHAQPAHSDAALTEQLSPGLLAARPFLPLPVLGVPGWWAENEQPAFYDDPAVFRPPWRQQQPGLATGGLNRCAAPASAATRAIT